jgi:hypothetical protein
VHTLGDRVTSQLNPASTAQAIEHPSLLVVLPSSHASPESSRPFPQNPLHMRAGSSQC